LLAGEAAALGAAATWALSTIAIKGVTGRLGSFYIMAMRTGFAAVVLVITLAILRPSAFDLDLPAGTLFVLLGSALLAILGDVSFVRAISVEDVSRVFTVSTSFYILISVGGSVVLAGEPFSWFLVFGGAAVLAGARLVVADPDKTGGIAGLGQRPRRPVFGLLLSLVASVLWSTSLLAVSDPLDSVDALTASALRLPFMAACLALVVLARGDVRRYRPSASELRSLAVSGAFVLASMVCFLTAAELASAGSVAVLTSTSPIFAVPLAFFLLHEQVSQRVLAGTAACMLGIWLTFV
jgi:drug/metabolite transporter (DMT)-like permease